MSMPLWLFSDETLTAMLKDVQDIARDPARREEILTNAMANSVAEEIKKELRGRRSAAA